MKLPLGIVSFVSLIALSATSAALILAPFAWQFGVSDFDIDGPAFIIDSPWAVWALLPVGLFLLVLSLNLFNGLAWIWRELATAMLGSQRFVKAVAPPDASDAPRATPPSPPSYDGALPA